MTAQPDSSKSLDILNTARQLFWKHGIRRVSVEEVCREAGVSKMTFYRSFPNKIELAKARDAAEAATKAGFSVDKGQIVLTGAIKDLGLHDVLVNLHPEVAATITLNVARSAGEAQLQEASKSIAELAAEEEAAAEFEIQELFDDIGGAAGDEGGPAGMETR